MRRGYVWLGYTPTRRTERQSGVPQRGHPLGRVTAPLPAPRSGPNVLTSSMLGCARRSSMGAEAGTIEAGASDRDSRPHRPLGSRPAVTPALSLIHISEPTRRTPI